MVEPPNELDGANVIFWAWSGPAPFGFVLNSDYEDERIEVYGLAVCYYSDNEGFYRFSCDRDWEVIQDGYYSTIEQAMEQIPDQYRKVRAIWYKK